MLPQKPKPQLAFVLPFAVYLYRQQYEGKLPIAGQRMPWCQTSILFAPQNLLSTLLHPALCPEKLTNGTVSIVPFLAALGLGSLIEALAGGPGDRMQGQSAHSPAPPSHAITSGWLCLPALVRRLSLWVLVTAPSPCPRGLGICNSSYDCVTNYPKLTGLTQDTLTIRHDLSPLGS